jgi:flagellar hook assembly protein FlgD
MGKAVKTLMETEQGAGDYAIAWDGKDTFGQPVASGTYFYKLIAKNFAQVKRMVLVR